MMAVRETDGWVPPKPVTVVLTSADIAYARRIAKERAEFRGYARSRSTWKRGLIRDPIILGTIGEIAFVLWVNRVFGRTVATIDDTLRQAGDGGADCVVCGARIQVKSESKERDTSMVRRIAEDKRILPLEANYYVFVTVADIQRPQLRGWVSKDQLCDPRYAKRRPAWKGAHHNQEIKKSRLEPMCRLRAILLSRDRGRG